VTELAGGIAPPIFLLRGAAPRSKVLGRPAPARRTRSLTHRDFIEPWPPVTF
jgi:hypothetical protein